MEGIFIFAIIVAIAVLVTILGSMAAKKRTAAMQKVADFLGLAFHDGQISSFDEQFPFLEKLCQGLNRYAFNVISGQYLGHEVSIFDYHYETHSTDSKGRRQTHHHYFSFFMLMHPKDFPELIICREGWFNKLVQFFGFDDIDFESAEFSRLFQVRSPNKKFAYDICHGRMIDFLLENQDLNIEMEHNCVTLFFQSQLNPEQIPGNLTRLIAIRKLFPEYVMKG